MGIRRIETEHAPKAIGPYSQGVVADQTARQIYVSGQLPMNPETDKLVEGEIETLTNQVIDNLEAILKAENASLTNVVRIDIFLTDLANDFAGMNKIYTKRFKGDVPPARQTVEVSALPKNSRIEMSCIAHVSNT